MTVQEDATDRCLAEERVRRSEERNRALADASNAGIGVTDAEEAITFANPAFAEMLGYDVDELQGTNLASLTSAAEYAGYIEKTERRREHLERNSYETVLQRRDGSLITVLVSAAPLTGPEGTFLGTLAVLVDITERKRSEDRLAASLQRLQELNEKLTAALTGAGDDDTAPLDGP
jgi:PAS domain S-box-containing protein